MFPGGTMIRSTLGHVFFACAIIAGAAVIVVRPEKLRPHENWDMIGYIGAAMMYDTSDAVEIHNRTYAALKQGIGPDEYKDFTRKGYDGDNATNPYHFAQQLVWASVKPVYVMLVYAFHWMGWVRAAVFISAASWTLIAVVLLFWTKSIMLSLLLAFCPPIFGMARLGTPDALAAVLVVAAVYVFCARRNMLLGISALLVSIWVRPDNVVLVGLLLFWLFLTRQINLRYFVSLSAIGLASCAILNHFQYPWSVLFYHTFVELLGNPAEVMPHITAGKYLKVAIREALPLIKDPLGSYMIPFVIIGLLYSKRSLLLYVIIASIAIRYFLFPSLQERFYACQYLLIGALAAAGHIPATVGAAGADMNSRPVAAMAQ